ncbi:MAG: uncharacterized protein A8A55_2497 [Amphiamblys sp. WSBS2006]|nr:MAG: uncharacterized protein A8A55_2497 [Amphiamblys sp. WSBS2006]
MSAKDRERTRKIVSLVVRVDLGLETIKKDALEMLSDVFEKYIRAISLHASRYAEHAHRQHPNLFDLLITLEKIDVFSYSAEDLLKYLEKQKPLVKDIAQYQTKIVAAAAPPEQPAPAPYGERTLPEYIPQHFPLFPPLHTYSKCRYAGKRDEQQWATIIRKEQEQLRIVDSVTNLLESIEKSPENQ